MLPIQHIEINVKDLQESVIFYEEILKRLDWNKTIKEEDMVGFTKDNFILFLHDAEKRFKQNSFHRKRVGINHIAFPVESREKVNKFYKFLKEEGVNILYGGPKEYPEYQKGYYALYFEDPDRIKLEIVYCPDK